MDAHLRDQIKAGDKGADNGAGGVDGVQQTDASADAILAGDRRLNHQRQGGAHQRGRHDQDDEGDNEANDCDRRQRIRQRWVNRDPGLRQCVEDDRRYESGNADQRFRNAEGRERPRDAGGQAPGGEAANAETGHEAGEHGAGGIDGDAEHQREQPQPHHLVHERADARAEEQEQEQREQPTRRAHRSWNGEGGGTMRYRRVRHGCTSLSNWTSAGLCAETLPR